MGLGCGTYIFFGKVIPERANVTITPLINEIRNLNGERIGEITGGIYASQITVQVTLTKEEIDNIRTLKNAVDEVTRTYLDVLGYTNSCGYEIEITQAMDLSGYIEVFGVNLSDPNKFPLQRPKTGQEILNLLSNTNGDYLRLCLGDLRESLRKPKDTGFFCYRSIECLRQYFVDANKLDNQKDKDRNKSWAILRDKLDIDRNKIYFIKKFADPVRHGGKISYSGDDATKMYAITWEIIDKYIIFACNGYKKLKNESTDRISPP